MKDFKLRFRAHKCNSSDFSVIDVCIHLEKDVEFLDLMSGDDSFLVDCQYCSSESVEDIKDDGYVKPEKIFWLYMESNTLFIRVLPEAYKNGWYITYCVYPN